MPCPACKIILDGGRLAAAARGLARKYSNAPDAWHIVATAEYLADVVSASMRAVMHGIKSGQITGDQIDEAHAWSELQCHRAAAIESAPEPDEGGESALTPALLIEWAHEDRLHATKLFGGEYHGAWEIDGVKGITKKTPD